jgi:putative lipoic acid-binding regulatory protein
MLLARNSRHANYVGLTATIEAQSRDQLDAIYRELCAHPLVKLVL